MATEHYLGGGWRCKLETEHRSISLSPHPKQDKSAQGRVWDDWVQWESGEILYCRFMVIFFIFVFVIDLRTAFFVYFSFAYSFFSTVFSSWHYISLLQDKRICSVFKKNAFFRVMIYQKQRTLIEKHGEQYIVMIAKRNAPLSVCDPQPWRSREWPHKYRIWIRNDLWKHPLSPWLGSQQGWRSVSSNRTSSGVWCCLIELACVYNFFFLCSDAVADNKVF